ncbi:MAG: SDR family oxidoreductase [Betaproteobacteria bacterium]|nr:SDR family oxidoreductase [Betaproteobacteria bacterium]
MRLKGKTALIAGAARNIGKATALTFAREGANLVLVAKSSRDELNAVAEECKSLGVQALPLLADVGLPQEVERIVQAGLERFGYIDTLVSVAAIRPHKPFWEISIDEWHRVFEVNLHSTFYLAKALAPTMMKSGKGGSVVALGGMASLTGQPIRAHVVASKTGLYGLIKSLALELGPYNVRANLIAVGFIDTKRLNPEWYASEQNNIPYNAADMEATPLRRAGTPQEVANVALLLASDQSSFVTGDRIVCAGGRYM